MQTIITTAITMQDGMDLQDFCKEYDISVSKLVRLIVQNWLTEPNPTRVLDENRK